MKFFKRLLGNAPGRADDLQKNASGSKPDLDYELSLLEECKQKRDANIEDMATLKIEDIDRSIAAYQDQVNAYISRGKIIICRIIEEKISQLTTARKIVQKRMPAPAFFTS
ncbi:MAG: hypothetical protein M3015_17070 [Bacteroidota bacterium]|nr:hypothetical protein [Bacteroidota bacterium]